MLCQNCGKNEVNFHYTQVINGVKKEMALCDKCAKSLGLESTDFNMPINFSSFLGDFLTDITDSNFMPSFNKNILKCKNCQMTYDDFINTGKLGCSECYNTFADSLNYMLKNIHGSSGHTGRINKLSQSMNSETKKYSEETHSELAKEENPKHNEIEKLEEQLKLAIKEERYEDAAKIRDEIKRLQK